MSARAIITEIDEYKGVITSREGSPRLSLTKVRVYVAELRGCDKGAVTCVPQGRCRAGWPIYILYTNGCLIRPSG